MCSRCVEGPSWPRRNLIQLVKSGKPSPPARTERSLPCGRPALRVPDLFIVTIPRSTSGFSQSRVQQGRQVGHMREIMRPLGPTIEKQGRKPSPHGTAHVVFQVVADTEDLPGR